MTRIETESGHLSYKKHVGGKENLLLFHGFGQTHEIFSSWFPILEQQYTVYTFDLFYHGSSVRNFGRLSKEEWGAYLQKFLQTEGINHFSVVGYSLGGRFAISTALSFPQSVRNFTLIAPDGIYLSLWFKLATKPLLRTFFRYFMYHPTRLDQLFRLNDRIKLINPYLGDFVKKELGDVENRKRVYRSWNDFKSLGYTHSQLHEEFEKHSFAKKMIVGSKDKIIHPTQILPLIASIKDFEVEVLPLKHHQLTKTEIAELLK